MKSKLQNTGTGVTVFAILVMVMVLCMPGIAGSKSELPEVGLAPTSTLTASRHGKDSRAVSKRRGNGLKSRKTRKKRLAAMVYFWYAMSRKNQS